MTSSSDCSLAALSPKMLPPFGWRRVESFDVMAGRGFGAVKRPGGLDVPSAAGVTGSAATNDPLRRVVGAGFDDCRFGRELGRFAGGSVFGSLVLEACEAGGGS